MTTNTAPLPGRTFGDIVRVIPWRPAEGLVSLLAAALMTVVVGWSFQRAGWTAGPMEDSDFLAWVALSGLALGVLGAKVGWGRWRTHLIGASFAGLILPLIVGGIVLQQSVGWDPAGLAERWAATLDVVRNVWTDLVVFGRPFTTEIGHYHLVFGALVWGAGMLAGFTVFGHRRPLDAVVVLGLVLLANMALTRRDETLQLALLVTFSCASLLLLIRGHVFEEELIWARRKIGDPAAIRQLYLVAGAQFVIVAVLGSVVLTATASSAPLQGLWQDLPGQLSSISQWLQRLAPPGGEFRGIGAVTFGDNAATSGQWQPSDRVAFRAQLPPGEEQLFKWRAGTYAEYTAFGWDWGSTRTESTSAGAPLLAPDTTGDKPTLEGRREISFRIVRDAFGGSTILGPNTLQTVDRPTNALVVGADGWFTTVESTESSGSYNATALIPVFEAVAGGITEPRLRSAGTDYPAEIRAIYLALPDGVVGPAATALLEAIRGEVVAPSYADPANAYDLARTMEAYLRNPSNFTYDEDVRDLMRARCAGVSSVECFALIRRGYCDFYASTMAVLLRSAGVPVRVAYGFLPGDRGQDGLEVVGAWTAHYWVEVYFPGSGWIEFDPTGGGVGQPQAIPTGSPAAATARPSGPGSTMPNATNPPTGGPGGPVTPGPDQGTGIGPFIAIALILGIGVLALAFAAYRRLPTRPMHPDQAWGSLARLAARVGLGPRPAQTVYEYAGALGDAVPAARVELTTIARAKVEVAYGRQDLGSDRLRLIAEAYRRLRFAILGVVLRRGLRRRPRRR